jgi:hypothetical protein
MNPLSVWRDQAALVARHPSLVLLVSLALAGTNLLFWRLGGYDGVRTTPGATAAFLLAKVAILLAWALLALRLVDMPERSIGSALRLDRQQLGWLAGTLLALPPLYGLRVTLTKLAGLGLIPPAALAVGLILYLIISLILLVRLFPALIGVLLGDRAVSLGWSWRATAGRVLSAVGFVLLALAPLLALHAGLNLLSMTRAPALRATLLLADGAVMALLMATAMTGYRALYVRAKAAP